MLTMSQSMYQEMKKASLTDVDQNSTQIYGKATFDLEYPTSVRRGGTWRAFCNSPFHVAVLVVQCLPALAAIVIVLILQTQKLTALCYSAAYRFCWCALGWSDFIWRNFKM
jgi:hypothetical protein